MEIKKAQPEDLEQIMQIYAFARQFMKETGNGNQWIGGYPSIELVRDNMQKEGLYVCLSGEAIVGVFYFKIEEDPTYNRIDEGAWLNDKPYGVVHRLAGNGKQRGIAGFCLAWCFEQCKNIRIDTHRDNWVMQNILKKNGYRYCGIIYTHNGSERLAFQKVS
ncbi:MAG: GNAT family N-acetyltransferase [Tannerellaceae bacterium]|nr:GNAT family N-acetyltransferase [Tannerellaceae bacterium]